MAARKAINPVRPIELTSDAVRVAQLFMAFDVDDRNQILRDLERRRAAARAFHDEPFQEWLQAVRAVDRGDDD